MPRKDKVIVYRCYIFWRWQYIKRNYQYVADYTTYRECSDRWLALKEKLRDRGLSRDEANEYTRLYNTCINIHNKYGTQHFIDFNDNITSEHVLQKIISNKDKIKAPFGFDNGTYLFPPHNITSGDGLFSECAINGLELSRNDIIVKDFYNSDIEMLTSKLKFIYHRKKTLDHWNAKPHDPPKNNIHWEKQNGEKTKYHLDKWEEAAYDIFKININKNKFVTTSSLPRAIGLWLWDVKKYTTTTRAIDLFNKAYHSSDIEKQHVYINGYNDINQLKKLLAGAAKCIESMDVLPIS